MLASLILAILFFALGYLLARTGASMPHDESSLADAIQQMLPQTQCGQCGYPGCRPYAEAIAADEAPINQCAPGGQVLVDQLAETLGRPAEVFEAETPDQESVAVVIEKDCIGCTKCIQACPVDAIIGAAKLMHTVLPLECTGCELCLPVCPVDCLVMRPAFRDPWS